jgi:hypothetical protein
MPWKTAENDSKCSMKRPGGIMSIFIMLTKISPGAKSPKSLRRLEMRVNERIKAE